MFIQVWSIGLQKLTKMIENHVYIRSTDHFKQVRAAANESQKTRNKKQKGLAHSQFIVCVTPKQRKTLLDSRIMF